MKHISAACNCERAPSNATDLPGGPIRAPEVNEESMTYVNHEELSRPETLQNIRCAGVITEGDMQWGLHKDDRDQYTGHGWYIEGPHRWCCRANTHRPVLH